MRRTAARLTRRYKRGEVVEQKVQMDLTAEALQLGLELAFSVASLQTIAFRVVEQNIGGVRDATTTVTMPKQRYRQCRRAPGSRHMFLTST